MTPAIAIVGMACRYPDANSPGDLWDNVLAQRSAFRMLPPERLSLSDYYSADRETPDAIYSQSAALIRDYTFDRQRFHTVGSTYRSADLSHWLALEVAADALADAGFPEGKDLPKATTGVILGNTLTGEMSRAQSLRLRWPYVRRTVADLLQRQGMEATEQHTFLSDLERQFKSPFEPIGSESLAGNLANTIAGRICNHFDLHGGGYTVDGACSSSLLAVTQACGQLLMGDLEVAIVGGVDISIDPFELVGFAKVGALTSERMLVYDQGSSGFIPGEGCGMVVLMTHEAAIAQQKRIYAVIRGWGISSDGQGGITRPEVSGQKLAIQNTYRRAEWNINSVAYFEGHGTGTVVGDATELQALGESRRDQIATQPEPAVIGSIKANIGHTKAAAGIAGLIKATLALHRQLLPPTSACPCPQERLTSPQPALKVLPHGTVWPAHLPLRAGVSAMGFGGINTHIALENPTLLRRSTLSTAEQNLLASHQDVELLLFTAETIAALRSRLTALLPWFHRLSRAELADLAHALAAELQETHPVRAAVVAESVPAAVAAMEQLLAHLQTSDQPLNLRHLTFNARLSTPRIGLLFPGQAAPVYATAGLWGQRFPFLATLHHSASLPPLTDTRSTQLAQPAIIASSLLGLEMLRQLHIEATTAIGHSLGELAALHWAGAMDASSVLQLASQRGLLMQTHGTGAGAMASLDADGEAVASLLAAVPDGPVRVSIAGLNSPRQTVVAGDRASVALVVDRAREEGVQATILPVTQAFHSPFVAPVVPPLQAVLETMAFTPLQHSVVSTVTGAPLARDADLQALLLAQVTQPVKFLPALQRTRGEVDLWLEVGPGHILSHLTKQAGGVRSVALDSGGASLSGLFEAIAAVFTLGGSVDLAPVFQRRFHRALVPGQDLRFFHNPCEKAPELNRDLTSFATHEPSPSQPTPVVASPAPASPSPDTAASPLDCLRQLVAQRTELPLASISDHQRFLSDLHLNSITVGQLVSEAAQRLGLQAPADPTAYANASLTEVAAAFTDLTALAPNAPRETIPAGVAPWLRAFAVHWRPEPLSQAPQALRSPSGRWELLNLGADPVPSPLTSQCLALPGHGVMVILPEERSEAATLALLHASQHALQIDGLDTFVLVHGGWGRGWAKSLHLEHPSIHTFALEMPLDHPDCGAWILAECQAGSAFVEARYNSQGQRFCPVLHPLTVDSSTTPEEAILVPALTANDCLLVTGGGKGIAAECALSMAERTGCELVLLGRSDPAEDPELAANLARFQARGIKAHYAVCDVGQRSAVAHTLATLADRHRPITAVLHGAGINQPTLITHLTPALLEQTFAPKVNGLNNVLACLSGTQLQHVITFGSIIAETGLPGEAHYALANEALAQLLHHHQLQNRHCHCLNLEWSVWSGMGMGERLGRIDSLSQQGIQPITPDQGIHLLHQLMTRTLPSTSVVVSGRHGLLPTIRQATTELPLWRFLEEPRVFYPGIELVVDVDLSVATDPYLRDHVYQGECIFPGVFGLEAMAQVAQALAGDQPLTAISEVQFVRPIVVLAMDSLTIRLAALARPDNEVEVVIRSAQTGFSVDHFRAVVCFGQSVSLDAPPQLTPLPPSGLEIHGHLYGELLFHQGRFQRLQHYDHLRAKSCKAHIHTHPLTPWFSDYLPQSLLLGDPGARDAAIHALQACVPHVTILPVGIQRLEVCGVDDQADHKVIAVEQSHDADQFVYDLWITTADGQLLERWHGLKLQVIQSKSHQATWSVPLLPPYLERCLTEEQPQIALAIALADHRANSPEDRSDALWHLLTGELDPITRRVDGKPDPVAQQAVSASHCEHLTLAISHRSTSLAGGCPPPMACDVEVVSPSGERPWQDLLGDAGLSLARLMAQDSGETLEVAVTRVWCARECLKKAGLPFDNALTLHRHQQPVVWLQSHNTSSLEASSPLVIATWLLTTKEMKTPIVIAILTDSVLLQSLSAV